MASKFQEQFCQLIESHPKLWVGLSVLFILIATPGLYFFQAQNDVRIWFPEEDENIQRLNSFEFRFGNDESLAIAIHHPENLFTPERMRMVNELNDKLWQIPQVIRLDALTNATVSESDQDEILIEPLFNQDIEWTSEVLADIKARALAHSRLPGYLISRDGRTTMSFARLAPTLTGSPDYKLIVDTAREMISEYQGIDGLEIHLSGEAAVNNAFREISQTDSEKILPLLVLVIIISLALLFHSFYGVLLPLVVTIFSVTSTLGLGFHFGLKFNSILNILPAILVAIAIADSVHVLMSYFQFRALGEDYKTAGKLSLKKNLLPTFLTSLTTMIGFLSLTMADLVPIQRLGLMAGLGCFVAWFLTIFLLCPVLLLYPLRLPSIFTKAFSHLQDEEEAKSSKKFIRFISTRPKMILSFFAVITIISFGISLQNEINSNPYSYFANDTEIKRANEFVKSNFGGVAGPELMISTGKEDGIKDPEFLKKVEAFKTWLHSLEFVDQTVDIIDIVKEMNQSLNAGDKAFFKIPETQNQVAELLFLYTLSLPQGMDLNNRMSLDFEAMRMTVLWRVQTSKDWGYWIKEIEKKSDELGLDLVVTGKTNLFQRMMGYVVATFSKSIITASVLVCLLMILLFRSVKIGLISLLPNILPLIMGGAFMKLTGMSLNIGTTLVASVCLGIAVDDTIHFLSNFHRLKKEGKTNAEALTYIMTFTGSALIVTTVILVAAFGLFILGAFVPNVNFGVMCAFVLTTALIVDLVFLPALLLVIKDDIKSS